MIPMDPVGVDACSCMERKSAGGKSVAWVPWGLVIGGSGR
jgi:hypothetical protein